MPFSILGATQLFNAAKLIARIDQGYGLIGRILFATLLAFRPSLTEVENAKDTINTQVSDFNAVFQAINEAENNTNFTFDDDAKVYLQFVSDVNEAIRVGRVPPKSKMPEIIPRMATALHVFNHSMGEVLLAHPATALSTAILKDTLQSAAAFVKHLESQEILCQFLKDVTNPVCDKTIEQPTVSMLKESILCVPGPVVSYRAFKHGKRSSRSVAEQEYWRATEQLHEDGFGRVVEFRVPRATAKCKVFIKLKPNPYPNTAAVSSAAFDEAFSKPLHWDIIQPMRAYLQSNNFIPK